MRYPATSSPTWSPGRIGWVGASSATVSGTPLDSAGSGAGAGSGVGTTSGSGAAGDPGSSPFGVTPPSARIRLNTALRSFPTAPFSLPSNFRIGPVKNVRAAANTVRIFASVPLMKPMPPAGDPDLPVVFLWVSERLSGFSANDASAVIGSSSLAPVPAADPSVPSALSLLPCSVPVPPACPSSVSDPAAFPSSVPNLRV